MKIKTAFLSLSFQQNQQANGQLPSRLLLIPPGTFTGRDGRTWHNPAPEEVIRQSRQVGRDIPIDIEHATEVKAPNGEPAPAQGWIALDSLEVEDGAIYGQVQWNESGTELLSGKSYKYYSPAFWNDENGVVLKLKSVGLTNSHNLYELPALNHESNHPSNQQPTGGPDDMSLSAAIRQALSLKEDANEADAVQAIGQLKSDYGLALNRAKTPDPEQFVPKADHELALNRANAAETELKAFRDKEVEAAVDAAIEAGKVAPASKEYHLATCHQEGGLERFQAFVASAPEIITKEPGKGGKQPESEPKSKLSADELAICHDLGLSEKEFLAARGEAA